MASNIDHTWTYKIHITKKYGKPPLLMTFNAQIALVQWQASNPILVKKKMQLLPCEADLWECKSAASHFPFGLF